MRPKQSAVQSRIVFAAWKRADSISRFDSIVRQHADSAVRWPKRRERKFLQEAG